ncbi:MAG: uracil-DNA glycosylase, partial [Deltaproteobacteria bacterium]|nr:uracil-DNA glycosylase [Deltaproteobacteria bacterium]
MGNFAAKTLLRTSTGITRLRGQFHSYHGIPVMPTFHPAYLLRNADGKRAVWTDLKAVMKEMDRLGLYRRR